MNTLFLRLLASGSVCFLSCLKLMVHILSPTGANTRLNVLVYHHVLPVSKNILDDVAIDSVSFNWQMRLISKVFNVMSVERALELIDKGNLPPRAIAITFDDGYLDNYTEAFPILKRYGLTATFFLVGKAVSEGQIWNHRVMEAVLNTKLEDLDLNDIGFGLISVGNLASKVEANSYLNEQLKKLPPEEQRGKVNYIVAQSRILQPKRSMLTEGQIDRMVEDGMTIGCHTMNHPMLSSIDLETAEKDIQSSKDQLSKLSGQQVSYFAYPAWETLPRCLLTHTLSSL